MEVLRDESIGYEAAIALGKVGDPRAIPPLKEMLMAGKPNDRLWAAYGLAKLGDPVGLPAVAEFLKDPSWGRRRLAVEALGEFRDARAVPALVEALKDESADVRVSVAKALGGVGEESSIRALEALLNDDAMPTSGPRMPVRQAALDAIQRIRNAKKGATQPAVRDASPPTTQAAEGGWGEPGTGGLRIRLLSISEDSGKLVLTPDKMTAAVEVWNTGDKAVTIAEQNTTGGRKMIQDDWLVGLTLTVIDANHGARIFFRGDNEDQYWTSVENFNGGAREIPVGGKALFKIRLHRLVDREGTNLLALRGQFELQPVLEILGYGGSLWMGLAAGKPVPVQIEAAAPIKSGTAPATQPATLDQALLLWAKGQTAEAAAEFLRVDWSADRVAAAASVFRLTEAEVARLPEAERVRKVQGILDQQRLLREVCRELLARGDQAAGAGQPDQAGRYFVAVRDCGAFLTRDPKAAKINIALGDALQRRGQEKLKGLAKEPPATTPATSSAPASQPVTQPAEGKPKETVAGLSLVLKCQAPKVDFARDLRLDVGVSNGTGNPIELDHWGRERDFPIVTFIFAADPGRRLIVSTKQAAWCATGILGVPLAPGKNKSASFRIGDCWEWGGGAPFIAPGRYRVTAEVGRVDADGHGRVLGRSAPLDVAVLQWPEEQPDGIRLLARPLKQQNAWQAGQTPQFEADLHNEGTRNLRLVLAPEHWQIEVDGTWYHATVMHFGEVPVRPLAPGQQQTNVPFSPDQRWGWRSQAGNELAFRPGKRVVRLALTVHPADGAGGKPVRPVSNPVELTIQSPPSATQPAEGEQAAGPLRLVLDRDDAGGGGSPVPIFRLAVENQGKHPVSFDVADVRLYCVDLGGNRYQRPVVTTRPWKPRLIEPGGHLLLCTLGCGGTAAGSYGGWGPAGGVGYTVWAALDVGAGQPAVESNRVSVPGAATPPATRRGAGGAARP
jgi:hypothetical protein